DLKLSMSRASIPTSMANVFSTNVSSCTAKSELTIPASNRSASSSSWESATELRMKWRIACFSAEGSRSLTLIRASLRRVSLVAVDMKAAAGLSSEVPRVHQRPQQGTAAVFRMVEAFVQDVERAHHGVQADQVCGLERPHPVAEAFLEDPVDVLGGRDPVLQDKSGLVHEEVRDPVRYEPRPVLDDQRP